MSEVRWVDGDRVTFTMQGDDDAEPDPFPYAETTVREVLSSASGLANVIVQFQNPFVLGGITLGATALVTWAFWPRRHIDDEPMVEGTESSTGRA